MVEQVAVEKDSVERVVRVNAVEVRRKRKRHRRYRIKKSRLALFAGLIILIVFLVLRCSGDRLSENAPEVTEIAGISVVNDILPEGVPGRPGTIRKIETIVIHETGNTGGGATAKSHNNYIHKAADTEKLSWHYTVDDHEIYHHLPDNEMGFHAGDGLTENGGNTNGIGVEMCVNQEGNFEQTLKNGAKLTAYLMKTYHLDIKDVKKHQDFSGKICPENLIKTDRWEEFLNMVQEEYAAIK